MKLQDLIQPIGEENFFQHYWKLQPLYIQYYEDFNEVLSLQNINDYLTKANLIYPFLRMVGDGSELQLELYSAQHNYLNVLNRSKVFKLFEDGNTIVIQGAQYLFDGLKKLHANLSRDLKSTANINIYITPSGSHGFHPHFDTHEVFVLQMFGQKKWRLYDQNIKFPLKGWGVTDEEAQKYSAQSPSNEITLSPGDFLYFPAGVVHDAFCEDELSIHLTIGVQAKTYVDFIKYLTTKSENEEFFRTPFDRVEQSIKQFKHNFEQLIESNFRTFNSYSTNEQGEIADNLFLDYCCADNLQILYAEDFKVDYEKIVELNETERLFVTNLDKLKTDKSESPNLLDENSQSKKLMKSLIRKGAIELNH